MELASKNLMGPPAVRGNKSTSMYQNHQGVRIGSLTRTRHSVGNEKKAPWVVTSLCFVNHQVIGYLTPSSKGRTCSGQYTRRRCTTWCRPDRLGFCEVPEGPAKRCGTRTVTSQRWTQIQHLCCLSVSFDGHFARARTRAQYSARSADRGRD